LAADARLLTQPRPRPFPLHTGHAEVAKVTRLTPGMTRVTLTAPAFADFGVEQPGEILTLGWPAADRPLVLPERGWRFPAGTVEQHWRNFTVRRIDPDQARLDVDFVLHGDGGRASEWAEWAVPGDAVGFAGPRTHWEREPDADWTLLVADETGLPALLAILETLPPGHPVIAVGEITDLDERQHTVTAADAEVHWVVRGDRGPESAGLLAGFVEALPLPPGRGRAWGGGEALAMRAVRDHLLYLRGLPSEATRILGYWKHDTR
jgi:NADPH-dependent ferric siderophore reductase